MEKWKCRYRELLKAVFFHPKKPQKTIRNKTFSWNLHEIFFKHFHEMSQFSGQNQRNGKQTYCRLPSTPFPCTTFFVFFSQQKGRRIMELKKWPKLNLQQYWSQVLINSTFLGWRFFNWISLIFTKRYGVQEQLHGR